MKLIMSHFSHSIQFFCILILLAGLKVNTWSHVASGVEKLFTIFDPYVSILDKENVFRYSTTDLIPLIRKVATRFSRVIVLLNENDFDEGLQTSRALAPLAISKYNTLYGNTSTGVLEVWLAYKSRFPRAEYTDEYKYHKEPLMLKLLLERLANDANTNFNLTVSTILLPYSMVRSSIRNNESYDSVFSTTNTKYRWGTLVDSTECTYSSYYAPTLQEIRFDVVIIDLLEPIYHEAPSTAFKEMINNCQNYIPDSATKVFLTSISDTYTHKTSNITGMLETWQSTAMWFKRKCLEVIISKTFDTPYEQSVHKKTSGWWRLKENTSYIDSNYYIFEEKAVIAEQIDMLENPENFNWLEKEILFSRQHAGIIFSTYTTKPSEFNQKDFNILISYIVNTFNKVIIFSKHPKQMSKGKTLEEIHQIAKLQGKMEIVSLKLFPLETLKRIVPFPIETSAKRYNFDKLLFSTYILPYNGSNTFEYAAYYKDFVLKNINATDYKIGFAFNTTICQTYYQMDSINTSYIDKTLKNAQAIYFMFDEDEDTVKLGANRMFLQRSILLEQCRKLLLAILENVDLMDITYVLARYPTVLTSEIYSKPWYLQNLVKYFKLLNDYAVATNASIVFNNAMDGKRYNYDRSETVSEMGWWRYEDNFTTKTTNRWIDKKHDALQFSLKYFRMNITTNEDLVEKENIILITVLPVSIIITIFGVALYMVRRYYQQTYLTKTDLDEFFLGNLEDDDNNGVNRLPYDKNRYEIDESLFSIDESQCLGSGEFGKVFRGKLVTENKDTKEVAVKTNNPKSLHKTTLSGLLSEIKVLAFMGSHKNIIELIGANTRSLKQGKVLIFLEFCHLGSLQNNLRKLRPITNDFVDTNGEQQNLSDYYNENLNMSSDHRIQRYLNIAALPKMVPDYALSDDLYRWSKEICEGMAYLTSKHVVHADLATRNVLLTINKEVKLCDFGLARRMYNYTNYVKQQQEPLPWKWMSPESLRLLEFSEKSDVWAYGVTLWEIYSLGDGPYPGLSWDPKFVEMLEQGLRLSEPKYNEREMYSIMQTCWHKSSERRPTFAELLTKFI